MQQGGPPIPVERVSREVLDALARRATASDYAAEDPAIKAVAAVVWSLAGSLSAGAGLPHLRETVYSDGLQGALKAIREFDDSQGAATTTYVYHVARNAMRHALRYAERRERHLRIDDAMSERLRAPGDAQARVELEDLADHYISRIRDKRLRWIIQARYGIGVAPQTVREVAETLGLGVGTIHKMEQRALGIMREGVARTSRRPKRNKIGANPLRPQ